MNQIMGFMKEIADKVFKTKHLTNRKATEHRLKLQVGDTIYCYTGLRTCKTRFLGDARVTGLTRWNTDALPDPGAIDLAGPSVVPSITWDNFIKRDGFDTYDDLHAYFTSRGVETWLCIEFEQLPKSPDGIYCHECGREIVKCDEAKTEYGYCHHNDDPLACHGWDDYTTAIMLLCVECSRAIQDEFCSDCETAPCTRDKDCWKSSQPVPYETYVAPRLPRGTPINPAIPRGQKRLTDFKEMTDE